MRVGQELLLREDIPAIHVPLDGQLAIVTHVGLTSEMPTPMKVIPICSNLHLAVSERRDMFLPKLLHVYWKLVWASMHWGYTNEKTF